MKRSERDDLLKTALSLLACAGEAAESWGCVHIARVVEEAEKKIDQALKISENGSI